MDTVEHNEGDARPGDIVVGAGPIKGFLVEQGMPEGVDPYYLKRTGWPIGNTSANGGGKLIASKRRLLRHLERLARGTAA